MRITTWLKNLFLRMLSKREIASEDLELEHLFGLRSITAATNTGAEGVEIVGEFTADIDGDFIERYNEQLRKKDQERKTNGRIQRNYYLEQSVVRMLDEYAALYTSVYGDKNRKGLLSELVNCALTSYLNKELPKLRHLSEHLLEQTNA